MSISVGSRWRFEIKGLKSVQKIASWSFLVSENVVSISLQNLKNRLRFRIYLSQPDAKLLISIFFTQNKWFLYLSPLVAAWFAYKIFARKTIIINLSSHLAKAHWTERRDLKQISWVWKAHNFASYQEYWSMLTII